MSLIVVTGSAGQLGSAICAALEAAGYDTLPLDVAPRTGGLIADVTRLSDLITIRDALTKAELESLGGLVCAHGIDAPPTINNTDPWRQWDQMLSVNLTGTMNACRVFGYPMIQNERGSIVNIASLFGVVAPPFGAYPAGFQKPFAYAASKAGVIGFTRALAAQWAFHNVKVNALAPGGIRANQPEEFTRRYVTRVPMLRMATLADVTGAVEFLLSEKASYITGQTLLVDGGYSVI